MPKMNGAIKLMSVYWPSLRQAGAVDAPRNYVNATARLLWPVWAVLEYIYL